MSDLSNLEVIIVKRYFCFILFVLVFLCGCSTQPSFEDWGSFTPEKAFSYDQKYYAVQEVVERDDVHFINVEIYTADHVLVDSFQPARAFDFWGICWEKDTYNIWIQSADIGVFCYSCDNEKWAVNTDAVRPDYIVSKYDK